MGLLVFRCRLIDLSAPEFVHEWERANSSREDQLRERADDYSVIARRKLVTAG